MEILESYYLWFLIIIFIVFIFTYKKITNNNDALTAKFTTVKDLKTNVSNIDNLLLIAFKNSGFRNIRIEKNENRIYAHTKFSMSSFSEYVEIFYEVDQFSTVLRFKSICALPTQIYDWGKNKRNFKKFSKELEKLLPPQVTITQL